MPGDMSKAQQKTAIEDHKVVEKAFQEGGAFEGWSMRKLSLNMTKMGSNSTKPMKYAGTCMLVRTLFGSGSVLFATCKCTT
jgi:hypothetical protein